MLVRPLSFCRFRLQERNHLGIFAPLGSRVMSRTFSFSNVAATRSNRLFHSGDVLESITCMRALAQILQQDEDVEQDNAVETQGK